MKSWGKIFSTLGIRLASDSKDDQKRVATPAFAKEQGCDYIGAVVQLRNMLTQLKHIRKLKQLCQNKGVRNHILFLHFLLKFL